MVIDWIMHKTLQDNTGIQWTFTKQLEDLDFVNDISPLSHQQQHAQTQTEYASREDKLKGQQKED